MILTAAALRATIDGMRWVAYVNPADLEDPVVAKLKAEGFEVEERISCVARKAFVRTPAIMGVIDLDNKEALLKVTQESECSNDHNKESAR